MQETETDEGNRDNCNDCNNCANTKRGISSLGLSCNETILTSWPTLNACRWFASCGRDIIAALYQ